MVAWRAVLFWNKGEFHFPFTWLILWDLCLVVPANANHTVCLKRARGTVREGMKSHRQAESESGSASSQRAEEEQWEETEGERTGRPASQSTHRHKFTKLSHFKEAIWKWNSYEWMKVQMVVVAMVCACVRRTMCVFLITALVLGVLPAAIRDGFGPASGQNTRVWTLHHRWHG